MSTSFAVVGGDLRQCYLAKKLLDAGYEVKAFDISCRDILRDYKNVIATDILMSNLSSTQIREELRLNYCDCKICDRVLKYIKENPSSQKLTFYL